MAKQKDKQTRLSTETLENQIQVLALARAVHYHDLESARQALPCGTVAEFDQRVRLVGKLSKGEATTTQPISGNELLNRKVLAETARQLQISPQRLYEALHKAMAKSIKDRKYIGETGIKLDDPHVQAISSAQSEAIKGLKQKAKDGSVKVEARITPYKGSAVNVQQ